MAVIPGSEGDFGVLAGHSLLISTLRPGVIEVWQGETVTERLFVIGGFAEVTETRCTVLADEAIPVAEINAAEAQADYDRLKAEFDAADEASNWPRRAGRPIKGGRRRIGLRQPYLFSRLFAQTKCPANRGANFFGIPRH
jgi:ATP synthase F1 epsilon subunit